MRKTGTKIAEKPILYNSETLQGVLGCGRATSEKIAMAAGARIVIGRRVLYDRCKIESYLETLSGQAEG